MEKEKKEEKINYKLIKKKVQKSKKEGLIKGPKKKKVMHDFNMECYMISS